MRPCAHLLLVAATAGLAGCGAQPGAGARGPEGTLFVLDRREDRVMVLDAAGGATRTVRPRGLAKCGPRMYVRGGRLVYVGYTRRASVAWALDPRRGRSPTRLGSAHEVIPSATPGRVWLAKVPRCRDVNRLRALNEVTLSGRITRRVRARVPGVGLIAPLHRGLLLFGPSGGLVAWNPGSRLVLWRERRAFALAAGGEVVAWCLSRGCREIRITDLRSGRVRRAAPPAGLSFQNTYEGALSPSGGLLAVPATAGKAGRLALVDTATGRAGTVPGSQIDRNFRQVAWSPSGWVFWSAGHARLMAYRPGTDRAVTLPVKLRHQILGLAAGA